LERLWLYQWFAGETFSRERRWPPKVRQAGRNRRMSVVSPAAGPQAAHHQVSGTARARTRAIMGISGSVVCCKRPPPTPASTPTHARTHAHARTRRPSQNMERTCGKERRDGRAGQTQRANARRTLWSALAGHAPPRARARAAFVGVWRFFCSRPSARRQRPRTASPRVGVSSHRAAVCVSRCLNPPARCARRACRARRRCSRRRLDARTHACACPQG